MQTKIFRFSFILTMFFGISTPALAIEDAIELSAPSNFALYSIDTNSRVMVGWSMSYTNANVSTYLSLDGASYFLVDSLSTDYYRLGDKLFFETSPLSAGIHTVALRSQDEAGHLSSPAKLKFIINAEGQIIELRIPGSPVPLDVVFADATLLMTVSSRANLEDFIGTSCELIPEVASTRVKAAVGSILDANVRTMIENFTACGTPTSLHHGAGERLAIINSYLIAFGRLPSTQTQWYDILKISNGYFPSEVSTLAKTRIKESFHLVYLREANMNVAKESNAISIMTYGLRLLPRNINSEVAAIKTFHSVYGLAPSSTREWDIVRAVAYSGATRSAQQ